VIKSPLAGRYELLRAQFYVNPSIHSLRGKFYDFELQIVFGFVADVGSGGTRAAGQSGLLPANQIRIVILFEAGQKCNPILTPITNIANQTNALNGTATTAASIPLCRLIPENTGFELYRGSSLFNGCPQTVAFAVATTPSFISFSQLAKFNKWLNNNGGLGSTDEHPQAQLYGRPIYAGTVSSFTCPSV